MPDRRRLLLAALPLWAPRLRAQPQEQTPWPGANAIRIVIPYPAGSSMDVMGRAIADRVARRWGRSVIVDHRAGASGTIGGAHVARSKPDGHTLLLHSMSVATDRHLYTSMQWNPLTDLRPVILICRVPNVLVVPANSPHATVRDLIEHARARPGELDYGSAGAGTSMHLSAELFMKETGTRMTHVPYRGATLALTDVIGGALDLMFANLASAQAAIQAGKVRALGLTTSSRSTSAPDIPTLAEAGVPGFEMSAWYGVMAPADTPEDVVERINQDMREALADPDVRRQFETALGMQIVASTRGEFADFLARESSRWGALIRSAGIRLD